MTKNPSHDPADQRAMRWSAGEWVGEADNLLTPTPKTPRWFKVLIALAVVGCFVFAGIALHLSRS